MSASQTILHHHFEQIVQYYHPFAEYIGYQELDDGFILAYQGGGDNKFMAIDLNFDVVYDETLGTTRSLELADNFIKIFDAIFG